MIAPFAAETVWITKPITTAYFAGLANFIFHAMLIKREAVGATTWTHWSALVEFNHLAQCLPAITTRIVAVWLASFCANASEAAVAVKH